MQQSKCSNLRLTCFVVSLTVMVELTAAQEKCIISRTLCNLPSCSFLNTEIHLQDFFIEQKAEEIEGLTFTEGFQ